MKLGAALALLLPAAAQAGEPPNGPVVTDQQVRIHGKPLKYTAETGRVAIRDAETGEPHGYMFYIAYRVPSPAPRPLTFVWNGGPGANSATLHFEVVGPKRADGGALVDNAETWLADTDLVFVDPIGTGFSRPAKAEYAQEFYGTVGDVASVAEFVRAWRLLHGAEDAPLFLAGESWGSGRAGSVGAALEARGIDVAGLILISGGTGLPASISPELRQALRVVDLSATAFHHGKVPAQYGTDVATVQKAADAFARDVYAPALAKPEALSDADRDALIAKVSAFTGLAPEKIDRKTLTFTPRQYLTGLLDKPANVFDMRLTAEPPERADDAILRYLRHDLGFATDLPYVGLEPLQQAYAPNGRYPKSVGARWNYATAEVSPEEMKAAIDAAIKRGGGPPVLGPPLPSTAEAIAANPKLKVLVAAGLYDSLNSCAANDEAGRNLPPALKSAVTFRCYAGGHMMYRDQPARLQLSRDVKALIASATR
jgi:carboxypeptidase C (cathepsin A)